MILEVQQEPLRLERLPWWAALVSAAAGGLLLDMASPGPAWWPLAVPGLVLVLLSVWQQRARFGLLAGCTAGAAFWMLQISWLTLYLGPIPWLALSFVMIAWFTLWGGASAAATRMLAVWLRGDEAPNRLRARPRAVFWVTVAAQALAVTGLWVLREQLQGAWPYGGFAWGRVAALFADTPLQQAVSWVGFAGLSALIVLACAVPVAVWSARRVAGGAGTAEEMSTTAGSPRHRVRPVLFTCAGSLVLLVLLGLLPAAPLSQSGTLRVAAIQGNSKSGVFDDRESGAVFQDHLDETTRLIDELEERGESVDLIVWPENSAEFEVRSNPQNARRLELLAKRSGAPIVVGSVLRDRAETGDVFTNSSLVWDADGATEARYDKRYPVPFAEYMPSRDFFHALVPDLVDLVQLDYAPGATATAFGIETGSGPLRAGFAICFDIIFDAQAVAMVDDGAEMILAQTNNADFGRTDESAQQLAIARLRAVETGRAIVNISTVGQSAILLPSGDSLDTIAPHTAGSMVAEVPLVTGRTPALRFGAQIAGVWMAIGALGLLVSATLRIAARVAPRSQERAA